MAHAAKAAAQSILIVGQIAYIALRLSFGGAVNPAAWSCCSEMITGLSNEIPLMKDWDPEKVHSPDQAEVQAPVYLDDSFQSAMSPAKPLSVHIPITALGRSDCFIDDIIIVMIDRVGQILRHSSACPLAIHVAMRPNAGKEQDPIPRRDTLSKDKLEAEGAPAESQIVLGWRINTRLLRLQLPFDKYTAWTSDISGILGRADRAVSRKELESLIGRLNHASFVIPLSCHFLSNLRSKLKSKPRPKSKSNPKCQTKLGPMPDIRSDNRTVIERISSKVSTLASKANFRWNRNQTYRLSDEDLEDLKLWILLLEQALIGI
jgi:hypothetical protein